MCSWNVVIWYLGIKHEVEGLVSGYPAPGYRVTGYPALTRTRKYPETLQKGLKSKQISESLSIKHGRSAVNTQ